MEADEQRRLLPGLEALNRPYWLGGAEGQLVIARCEDCLNYIHPPMPICPKCRSRAVVPKPVSGRGRVASFTINRQKWLPQMKVPFVFAAIELDEQPELYVFTNVIGCPVETVDFDMRVRVVFEQQEDVFLPMFMPEDRVA